MPQLEFSLSPNLATPVPQVLHLKQASYPQFRFEYHKEKKKVFIIRAASPTIGDPIAVDIQDEGAAWNAVLIWLRGYKEASRDVKGKD